MDAWGQGASLTWQCCATQDMQDSQLLLGGHFSIKGEPSRRVKWGSRCKSNMHKQASRGPELVHVHDGDCHLPGVSNAEIRAHPAA